MCLFFFYSSGAEWLTHSFWYANGEGNNNCTDCHLPTQTSHQLFSNSVCNYYISEAHKLKNREQTANIYKPWLKMTTFSEIFFTYICSLMISRNLTANNIGYFQQTPLQQTLPDLVHSSDSKLIILEFIRPAPVFKL